MRGLDEQAKFLAGAAFCAFPVFIRRFAPKRKHSVTKYAFVVMKRCRTTLLPLADPQKAAARSALTATERAATTLSSKTF